MTSYTSKYDEQLAWARRLSDAELRDWHARYRDEDDTAIRMGGLGIIDNPAWNAVKAVMVERGAQPPL